ncbi:MAG TPA: prephenate dehydrogenase/arogenate dehydrogenase family protein [Longimicrobium sp.]
MSGEDPAFTDPGSIRTVAVAGLGLIGGSVARDLAALGVRVLGHDRDRAAVDAALREGFVSAALGDGFAGVEDADALVIAVPVHAAAAVLERALPRLGGVRLVTDAGSTKRAIVAAAERLGIGARFVGAHPFAGDHRAGVEASRLGLFAGARVYLCPAAGASAEARGMARGLWTMLGGTVMEIGAEEHDARLAWTSHLPQLVSTALAAVLAARGIPRADLGPGGRDVTRLAASSPEMWTGIALENADALLAALDATGAQLAALRDALARRDEDAIRAAFASGQAWS